MDLKLLAYFGTNAFSSLPNWLTEFGGREGSDFITIIPNAPRAVEVLSDEDGFTGKRRLGGREVECHAAQANSVVISDDGLVTESDEVEGLLA